MRLRATRIDNLVPGDLFVELNKTFWIRKGYTNVCFVVAASKTRGVVSLQVLKDSANEYVLAWHVAGNYACVRCPANDYVNVLEPAQEDEEAHADRQQTRAR